MRTRAIVGCTVTVLGVGLAGCDGSLLEPLRADLSLTPNDVTVTSWIGYSSSLSFTATNSGRAALDVEAPLLSPLDETLEGTSVLVSTGEPNGTALEVNELRIEAGHSLVIDVTLAPTREGTSTLVLLVTPEDGDVAAASATIELHARTPPSCEANNPCETAVFDATLGLCVRTPRADGSACDDASACTTDDRCSQGACLGAALTCGDAIECTVDACDPSVGCVFTPVNERCADDNACTTDVCAPASGGCTNATAPDGTLCGPFSCAELSTCFFGACVSAPTPDGFPCEDGDLCTSGDTCASQECVPGDDVDPVAQAPVALARPPVHLSYDVRWFTDELGDSSLPPGDIDVAIAFGAVLDVAQAVVGARPTLAVLWRSQPFDVDGLPCSPWDMWRQPDGGTGGGPSFCASAVVVTFVDEAELALAAPAGAGTSIVLDVVYGTAGASFVARAPGAAGVTDDVLRVVLVESTYFPNPDPGREVHITRATLSFAARDVVARDDEHHYSGPAWDLTHNVHSGLRVAADDDGETLIGWDLPFAPPLSPTDDESDDAGDPEANRASIAEPPAWGASLDVAAVSAPPAPDAFGDVTWSALETDSCAWEPAPSEAHAWHDVDVVRDGARAWALARHRDRSDATNGCEPESGDVLHLSALEIDDDDGPTIVWNLGVDVRSASLTDGGRVLARLHEQDVDCVACAPYTLTLLPQPFDPSPDPVVTLEHVSLDTTEAFPVRVAALDDDAGVLGAIVVEHDIYSGQHRVRLLDAVDGDVVALDLASPFFDSRDAIGPGRVRALRSPLTPQRVYAVLPKTSADGTDDGVVLGFGCPFPTFPTLP